MRSLLPAVLASGALLTLAAASGVQLQAHEDVEPWWKQETIEYGDSAKVR